MPVGWPQALDLAAAELRRVYASYGPRAVFGGSYGWASAGRFYDAPRQLHRELVPADACDVSRQVLDANGNCSSGTVLMVLGETRAQRAVESGESLVAMAFGPGLTLCSVLLRAV